MSYQLHTTFQSEIITFSLRITMYQSPDSDRDSSIYSSTILTIYHLLNVSESPLQPSQEDWARSTHQLPEKVSDPVIERCISLGLRKRRRNSAKEEARPPILARTPQRSKTVKPLSFDAVFSVPLLSHRKRRSKGQKDRLGTKRLGDARDNELNKILKRSPAEGLHHHVVGTRSWYPSDHHVVRARPRLGVGVRDLRNSKPCDFECYEVTCDDRSIRATGDEPHGDDGSLRPEGSASGHAMSHSAIGSISLYEPRTSTNKVSRNSDHMERLSTTPINVPITTHLIML